MGTHVFSSTAFAGKRALITGASGGIGRAVAKILASGGAELLLADLDQQSLDQVEKELECSTGIATFSGDLTIPETRKRLVRMVADSGGIDFLIPAAGIYPEARLAEISDESWEKILSINLTAIFALTRDMEPYLNENGAVVNFGSIAGARGSENHSHYAATKGAIAAFSRSIARELAGRGIRVNIVAPGLIATSMTDELMASSGDALLGNTPMRRLGTAEEVAGTVVFLCTEMAAFITGETIHINGGLHMA